MCEKCFIQLADKFKENSEKAAELGSLGEKTSEMFADLCLLAATAKDLKSPIIFNTMLNLCGLSLINAAAFTAMCETIMEVAHSQQKKIHNALQN